MDQETRIRLLEKACRLLDFRLRYNMLNWKILASTGYAVRLNDKIAFLSFDDLFKRFLEVNVFWYPIGSSRNVKVNPFLPHTPKNNPFYGMSEEELAVKVDLDMTTALENRA